MSARRVIVALLLIATGAAGATAGGAPESGEQPAAGDRDAAAGRVVKVVDGDTIHVQVAAGREKLLHRRRHAGSLESTCDSLNSRAGATSMTVLMAWRAGRVTHETDRALSPYDRNDQSRCPR